MNAIEKVKNLINSIDFLVYLIALILSTLLIGYAPSSISLGLFVFFGIRYAIINKVKFEVDFSLILPMALYLLFILTMLWTVNQDQTLIGLGRTVTLFIIPFVFGMLPYFTKKHVDQIFCFFTTANVLLGMFFLIVASLNYFKFKSLSVFTYHDLVHVLNLNAIYVSIVFSQSLFYLLGKKIKTAKDSLKIIFFLAIIVLLSSKMMMLILLIGILLYLYFNYYKVKKVKVFLGIILGIVIVGLGSSRLVKRVVFENETKIQEVFTKTEFGQIYLWTGSSIRLFQLRLLKEQLEQEKIFWKGFGLFASRENIKERHKQFNTYPGFHDYNYHNTYAQILAETGIFGLLLILCMLFFLFQKGIKSKDYLFLMFAIAISFIFLTESLLWRQQGLFIFIIFYCLSNRISVDTKEKMKIY